MLHLAITASIIMLNQSEAGPINLDKDLSHVKTAFNEAKSAPRLLLILSPT